MENENVEFNEVKCKNLILGDEETGFINLKVSKIDDSPVIEINPSDSNEENSITIGFKDGRPILRLTSNEADNKKSVISLYFDDKSRAIVEIFIGNNEEDYDSALVMGIGTEGTPMLGMNSKHYENNSIVGLNINEEGAAQLLLSNRSIKGGFISMMVDNDDSFIVIKNYEELTDETESQKKSKGIYLVNNSDVTLIDVNGQVIGGRNTQKKNSSSEGKSNE